MFYNAKIRFILIHSLATWIITSSGITMFEEFILVIEQNKKWWFTRIKMTKIIRRIIHLKEAKKLKIVEN